MRRSEDFRAKLKWTIPEASDETKAVDEAYGWMHQSPMNIGDHAESCSSKLSSAQVPAVALMHCGYAVLYLHFFLTQAGPVYLFWTHDGTCDGSAAPSAVI